MLLLHFMIMWLECSGPKTIICHIFHNAMVSLEYVLMSVSAAETMSQWVSSRINVVSHYRSEIWVANNKKMCISNWRFAVTGDRRKGVTFIVFKRPLQTNEPINDQPIPTDGYVSVIAAIGTLNSRREANAHSHDSMNVNSDDIQIDFSSIVRQFWSHLSFILLTKSSWFNFFIVCATTTLFLYRWITIVKLH